MSRVESAVVVLLRRVEQEQVGQPLLGDESLQVTHVGVGDAGRPALQHVEPCDLAGRSVVVDLQQLADADGQRQTLAPRGVLKAARELTAIQRQHLAGVQAQPAGDHGHGLRVAQGEVGEVKLHTRIRQRTSSPFDRATLPPRTSRQGTNGSATERGFAPR